MSNHNIPVPPGYPGVEMIYVPPGKDKAEALREHELKSRPPLPPQPGPRKPNESREAFLKRHSRKCQVCRHPYRDAIEDAFVMWRRPRALAETYCLTGDSLYRHAVAFDLYAKRRQNFRSVLDNVMERGVETDITGETILGAVRAYACLTDDNRWIEPNTNVVFSTKPVAPAIPPLANLPLAALPQAAAPESLATSGPSSCPLQLPASSLQPPEPNRGGQELKIDLTP